MQIEYFDGTSRDALVVDREVPYPDGKLIVSRTDTKGYITHANQAFVDMSGYKLDELIGANHCILRHPDMPAAAFKDLWDTIQAGKKWHGYVKNLRKDGAYYWVKATVIPNIRNGQLMGYTSVRRKPSRTKVDASAKLYAEMLAGEASA
ncbi:MULTISPECIES: PAS domain-containing protein [Neptunomonas]|uniref:PAS domain S-box protein n=1 Tax=Neptunomonas marina TaxID=1815562 RepID=A0A437Q999_9GAMM|nr:MULTISPECIES: PAS domain-containing protein [Neptunomonas]RVU31046.1 PAS domain S-box protein [Neptunomonas marina]